MAEYVNLYLATDPAAPVFVERGKHTGRLHLTFGPIGDFATVVVSDDQARQLAEAIIERARQIAAAATFGPNLTASVRFPVLASSSRSRKLLMEMSTAESRPTCAPNKSASRGQVPVCMKTVPVTATKPKNRITNNSPIPR